MFVSEVNLTFQTLEQAMDLPPSAKVVAVSETGQQFGGVVKVRIVSTSEPPQEYSLPHLSMLGEAYRHPERYKADPAKHKGSTLAPPTDSGSGGEADVDVIKSR